MVLLRLLTFGCVLAVATSTFTGCSGKKDGNKDDKKDSKADKDSQPKGKKQTPVVKAEPIAHDKFPRPEGVEIVTTISDARTVMLRGPKKLDECIKFYEAELAKLEWTKNDAESETIDGVGFLAFGKGSLKISITLNPAKDGKSMTIMAQGSGMNVPADEN